MALGCARLCDGCARSEVGLTPTCVEEDWRPRRFAASSVPVGFVLPAKSKPALKKYQSANSD